MGCSSFLIVSFWTIEANVETWADVKFIFFQDRNNYKIEEKKNKNSEKEKDPKEAIKNMLPMQKGDVSETFASTEKLKKWVNYSPSTSIDIGVEKFVNWYKDFYL